MADRLDLNAARKLAELVDFTERRTVTGNSKPESLATVQLAQRTLALVAEVERLRPIADAARTWRSGLLIPPTWPDYSGDEMAIAAAVDAEADRG